MLKLKSPQIIEFYIYLRDAHNIKINNKYFFFFQKSMRFRKGFKTSVQQDEIFFKQNSTIIILRIL